MASCPDPGSAGSRSSSSPSVRSSSTRHPSSSPARARAAPPASASPASASSHAATAPARAARAQHWSERGRRGMAFEIKILIKSQEGTEGLGDDSARADATLLVSSREGERRRRRCEVTVHEWMLQLALCSIVSADRREGTRATPAWSPSSQSATPMLHCTSAICRKKKRAARPVRYRVAGHALFPGTGGAGRSRRGSGPGAGRCGRPRAGLPLPGLTRAAQASRLRWAAEPRPGRRCVLWARRRRLCPQLPPLCRGGTQGSRGGAAAPPPACAPPRAV
jgi:hypothetical protein